MKKHRDKRSDRKYIATGQVVAYDGGVPRILGGYVPWTLPQDHRHCKWESQGKFKEHS